MEKVRLYFVEAYDELVNKVTWPTWAELQDSSVVVLITAVILSLVIVAMDVSFKFGTMGFYKAIIGTAATVAQHQ
jgi:preprotein translocase subunit SecE